MASSNPCRARCPEDGLDEPAAVHGGPDGFALEAGFKAYLAVLREEGQLINGELCEVAV